MTIGTVQQPKYKGVAYLAKWHEAKRHFADGEMVLVSEHSDYYTFPVSCNLITHTRETTTWDELADQVRMWRTRYPNQRFYIVRES